MSDEQTLEDQPGAAEGEPKVFDEAYVKKLREENARYRTEAKGNAEAAARLAEIEEAQKSEAQKAAEKIQALEKENEAFKQEKQVQEWASEITKGSHIPPSALRGSTKEELDAHFEQLKSLIPEPTTQLAVIPGDVERTPLALNGTGIEDALRNALGMN